MSTNAGGTVQGGALPPVETEDVTAQPAPESTDSKTTEAPEKTPDPKAGEKQATDSQPSEDEGAKEKGPGPWDAEMQKRGISDPKFDAFLREVVQPYVTQLEQGGGGPINELFKGDVERAQIASEMLQAFVDDPETAYRDLGELLGMTPGVEGGEAEVDGLEGMEGLEEGEGEEAPFDERLDYVDQLMEREKQAQEDAEYESLLKEIGNRVPGGEEAFDSELFTHFVLSTGGNIDQALQLYMKHHKTPEPVEAAPPALGGGPATPNEAPQYKSIDDALSGFLAEDKARRAK